jgi:hypothetical protein
MTNSRTLQSDHRPLIRANPDQIGDDQRRLGFSFDFSMTSAAVRFFNTQQFGAPLCHARNSLPSRFPTQVAPASAQNGRIMSPPIDFRANARLANHVAVTTCEPPRPTPRNKTPQTPSVRPICANRKRRRATNRIRALLLSMPNPEPASSPQLSSLNFPAITATATNPDCR